MMDAWALRMRLSGLRLRGRQRRRGERVGHRVLHQLTVFRHERLQLAFGRQRETLDALGRDQPGAGIPGRNPEGQQAGMDGTGEGAQPGGVRRR